jgi:hypothetical protein
MKEGKLEGENVTDGSGIRPVGKCVKNDKGSLGLGVCTFLFRFSGKLREEAACQKARSAQRLRDHSRWDLS